jgi:aryl-alcohol dehydrogenase-like predicted oxidoreductase
MAPNADRDEGARMERRRLGRLGHESTVLIYGAAALADVPQDVADESIAEALEAGINHFDTAADYGDAELRMAPWMPRIRERIFLATKTGDRTADGAYDGIRRSLERLGVDRVDLLQLHAVGSLDELDLVTRTGGALEGAIRARDEGLVDAIGITGHGMRAPATHLEALARFDFATVLTPFNYRLARDAEYRRSFDELREAVREADAGLMLIKAIARNLWRSSGAATRTTWYEPLEEQSAIDAAVAFALSVEGATGITTPSDVGLLHAVIGAERRRATIPSEDVEATLEAVPEMGPLFVRVPGREVPDWLEPLMR